jgi:hypothetical protein
MSRTRSARRFISLGGFLVASMFLSFGATIANAQDEVIEEIVQPSGREFLIQVNTIDVIVRGSGPAQASVSVDGVVGDGCTRLERIEQSRSGNTVSVRIVGYHTGDPVCTMQALLYRDNVGLEGTFEPGSYVVDVNGVTREFRAE